MTQILELSDQNFLKATIKTLQRAITKPSKTKEKQNVSANKEKSNGNFRIKKYN